MKYSALLPVDLSMFVNGHKPLPFYLKALIVNLGKPGLTYQVYVTMKPDNGMTSWFVEPVL